MIKQIKSNFKWNEAKYDFYNMRKIVLPVNHIKDIKIIDDFNLSKRESDIVENMKREALKNIYYSCIMLLEKFIYVEKVGQLKFDNEQEAKDTIFPIVKSKPSFSENWILGGVDNGCLLNKIGLDNFQDFPVFDDERKFYNDGVINNFVASKDIIQNGLVVCRDNVFQAIKLIWYKEKMKLEFRIQKQILLYRCKNL